jgi:hypothetical protein
VPGLAHPHTDAAVTPKAHVYAAPASAATSTQLDQAGLAAQEHSINAAALPEASGSRFTDVNAIAAQCC